MFYGFRKYFDIKFSTKRVTYSKFEHISYYEFVDFLSRILIRDDVLELLFRISITDNEFNIQ